MKKLVVIAMLFCINLTAQSFDFECEPEGTLLGVIISQEPQGVYLEGHIGDTSKRVNVIVRGQSRTLVTHRHVHLIGPNLASPRPVTFYSVGGWSNVVGRNLYKIE